ncbi:MAG: cytochrome, partial [Proteobacteria bacterium]
QGYDVKVASLDEGLGTFASEEAVIIVTASYEGQPPDNARRFVSWLEKANSAALNGLRFAVFGCGNRDWTRTYQAVPSKIDQLLEKAGAERLLPRGEADARADFFGDFDNWYQGLWPTLSKALGQELLDGFGDEELVLEFLEPSGVKLMSNHQLELGTILENRELVEMSKPGARSKRHIVLDLPKGSRYQAGDYLSLLPQNSSRNISRVLRRFALDGDAEVQIHAKSLPQNLLPRDRAIRVMDLLRDYVELSQPATRAQVKRIAEACPCPPEKYKLLPFVSDELSYRREILDKRVSVLDLLERSPSCSLSFASFLSMLPALKPRQYSISSSALWAEDRCTLTVALVKAPSWSGQGDFMGVASEFLSEASPGSKVGIMPKASQQAFHLPRDPLVPIVLSCAGTGLAPFRGFLQERAILKGRGVELGPALLFFGCDHPDVDYLYRGELEGWERDGVVKIYPAFSSLSQNGVSFVQDRIWQERDEVMSFFEAGAHFYVCGDGRFMAPAVKETFMRIYQSKSNCSAEEIERWFTDLEKNTRYVTDVFS